MLNSPSTPTSSTSTRDPATMDGWALRAASDIRADLDHPVVQPLLDTSGDGVGVGPIVRLLRDVAPLLTEVELKRGRCDHRWASGQDRNPHECTQTTHHLGLHRCGCGAVSA